VNERSGILSEPRLDVVVSQGDSRLNSGERWLITSMTQVEADGVVADDDLRVRVAHHLLARPDPIWLLELGSGSPADGRKAWMKLVASSPAWMGYCYAPANWGIMPMPELPEDFYGRALKIAPKNLTASGQEVWAAHVAHVAETLAKYAGEVLEPLRAADVKAAVFREILALFGPVAMQGKIYRRRIQREGDAE
jgi:hypothetical protein